MRKGVGVAAVLVGLGLAAPAMAQRPAGLIGGFGSTNVVNQPIDTTRVVTPTAALPTTRRSFDLFGLFRQISLPGFPPRLGVSPFPPPSSFPSTHYPNTFQPRMPIIPPA